MCAANGWSFGHIDLKTAFLQGEEYDWLRDVICQLPPEAGYPSYIGARLKKPAYGMNDAPRRWWNRIDASLRSYGMTPARADRCVYIYATKDGESRPSWSKVPKGSLIGDKKNDKTKIEDYYGMIEDLMDYARFHHRQSNLWKD